MRKDPRPMDDALLPEDEAPPMFELAAEPPTAIEPEVEFVVPAAAYDSIATDDELALLGHPRREPPSEDSPKVVSAIRELAESLGKRLDGLQTLFDREIRAEATREK